MSDLMEMTAAVETAETFAVLRELPVKVQQRYLRRSVNKALSPVVKDLKSRLPSKSRRKGGGATGTYRKNVARKVVQFTGGAPTTWGGVGARNKRVMTNRGPRNPAYYSHLLERGAKAHQIGTTDRPLLFTANGRPIFRMYAAHPGMAGQRPVEKSQRATQQESEQIVGKDVNAQIVRDFSRGKI